MGQTQARLRWITACVLSAGLALSILAHSGNPGSSGMKTLEGKVWYRERMLLPPDAEILIHLEDVSRADAPADVIASTHMGPEGGPPWHFALDYDPTLLNDRGRYAMRVRIERDGQLLFINTQHVPAFENTPVNVLVSRVAGGPTQTRPPEAGSIVDLRWQLVELNGQPAATGAGGRAPDLSLASDGQTAAGFSGCNRFTGSYELAETRLSFGPLASTRMACAEGMELEQQFLAALERAVHFSLQDGRLSLRDAEGRPLLRFEAE
jgi:putative lipoprotein